MLAANRDKYWTNDLVYDLMIDLLGIENAPHYHAAFDLASPSYGMSKDELRTLHGERCLSERD